MSMIRLQSKLSITVAAVLLSVSSAKADFRCERATDDLNAAQAGLQQATAILGQVQQICGGALPCIVTAQNAYNQAVTNVTAAQRRQNHACGCQGAINSLNAAQAGFTQAQAILMNVNNVCGGALACIVTAQNAYNQAQTALTQAQNRKAQICGWNDDGGGFGGGGRHRRPRGF